MTRPSCPSCGRRFSVSTTRIDADLALRVRYLACRRCHVRAESPEFIALSDAPIQATPGRPRTTIPPI
jgi:transcription elongation factor Elf1